MVLSNATASSFTRQNLRALAADEVLELAPPSALVRRLNQGLAQRFAWTGCPCCPVNLVRFLPRVGDYSCAVRDNDLFVNLPLALLFACCHPALTPSSSIPRRPRRST